MEILFRDDRVVVCVKPAGVLSTDAPGGMPSLIREALGEPEAVIRGVHRLDRPVGGVMVYARTRRAASDLGRQMEEGAFRKRYLAVVRGVPVPPAGSMRDWLIRDRVQRRTFVVPAGTPQAREAMLAYRTLESGAGLSLVSVRLLTGRTHQIRCQFASRGLPLAGDGKYGGGDGCDIALWSYSLSFRHPRDGREMVFSRLPPAGYPWNLFSEGYSLGNMSAENEVGSRAEIDMV